MRIEIILFDGFDELDAIGPFEVFQNAAEGGVEFDVRMVSSSAAREVKGAHGLVVQSDEPFPADQPPQLVIVPGGGWVARNACGARAEVERGDIPARIKELHAAGATIAAVCTGAMLVAAAGLLRDRSATTHHCALDDLHAAGVSLIDARVVDDGEIITCGGVTSGIDLALWIVERYCGCEAALHVAREMEYERRGNVWQKS
jgi:transcriptional regulator GlxA family with amidase domain